MSNALRVPDHAQEAFKRFVARAGEEQTPCTQSDPELWWSLKKEQTEEAKKQCQTCPLIGLCLMYALDAREKDGVWGGKDEAERNAILGRRSRADKAAKQRLRRLKENEAAAAEQAELEPALF